MACETTAVNSLSRVPGNKSLCSELVFSSSLIYGQNFSGYVGEKSKILPKMNFVEALNPKMGTEGDCSDLKSETYISDIKEEMYFSDESAQYEDQKNFSVDLVKLENSDDISEHLIHEDIVYGEDNIVKNEEVPVRNTENQTDFDVSNCHPCGDTEENLEIHVKSVRPNIQYKCAMCIYSTKQKKKMKQHLEFIHMKHKKFKCNVCVYATYRESHLKKHIDSVHLHIREFACTMCDYSTRRKSYLENHVKSIHFNLRQHKCTLCNYSSPSKGMLKHHQDSFHSNIRRYKCDTCGYPTNHKGALRKHIQSVHLNIREHKCSMCDYAAKHKGDLRKHVEIVHLNMRKFKCGACDFATNYNNALKKHVESAHSNEDEVLECQ